MVNLLSVLLDDTPPPMQAGRLLKILRRQTEDSIERLEIKIRHGHHCLTLTENYSPPEINTWSRTSPNVVVLPTGIHEHLKTFKGGYPCITEDCNHNQLCVYLKDGQVPRWERNGVLTWFLCSDDGRTGEPCTPCTLDNIEHAMINAGQDWNDCNIGIQFKQVFNEQEALFRVMCDEGLWDAYAVAFAPSARDRDRIVYVSPLAFQHRIVEYLREILTHELGHVLGLRHHFWSQIYPECEGRESALSLRGQEFEWDSVMNPYHADDEFSRLRISQEDADFARYFYNAVEFVDGYPMRIFPTVRPRS